MTIEAPLNRFIYTTDREISREAVKSHDGDTPHGFFVDFQDRIFQSMKNPFTLSSLDFISANDHAGIDLLRQSMLLMSGHGYPIVQYEVETVDGYRNLVFRLPRAESRKVLLLVCGLMDTSVAWISNPASQSLATQAWNLGYDVYMLNFRGTDAHCGDRVRHINLTPNDREVRHSMLYVSV